MVVVVLVVLVLVLGQIVVQLDYEVDLRFFQNREADCIL